MNWGLIVICAIALGLFAALNRGGKSSICPRGCHGCGRCMSGGNRERKEN